MWALGCELGKRSWLITKYLKGDDSGLFQGTIPAFTQRLRKTLLRIVLYPAKIQSEYLPYAMPQQNTNPFR
jgi:hypothetical protein